MAKVIDYKDCRIVPTGQIDDPHFYVWVPGLSACLDKDMTQKVLTNVLGDELLAINLIQDAIT